MWNRAYRLVWVCVLGLSSALVWAAPQVEIKTSMGVITAELNADKAPESVKNFLAYTKAGHYNGTVFHRVIDGFMIQGGGFDLGMTQKKTQAPVRNEANNGLRNQRYTLAMARTSDPHSATAQFFINVGNNDFLDHRGQTQAGWGYAVFGRVIRGEDIVQKIARVATGSAGGMGDVPVDQVIIESVRLLK
ncbi:MAG: peptidyl-prolyl cis-trans isomerase [Betaproteobacteria bacterium]|nr:MAG: peptidyl-prolyl cis-trans isomerase [Betaproteobacteria bacterium]